MPSFLLKDISLDFGLQTSCSIFQPVCKVPNQYTKIKNNRIARRTLKVVAASRPGTSKPSEFVSYCSQYCVNSKLEFNDANIMRTSIRRLALPTSPPCYLLLTTCVFICTPLSGSSRGCVIFHSHFSPGLLAC